MASLVFLPIADEIEEFNARFIEMGLSPADVPATIAQYKAKKKGLEDQLAELAVESVPLEVPPEFAGEVEFEDGAIKFSGMSVVEYLNQLDGAARNRVMRRYFESITIAPGHAPIAQRVAAFKMRGFSEVIPGPTTFEEIQPDPVL